MKNWSRKKKMPSDLEMWLLEAQFFALKNGLLTSCLLIIHWKPFWYWHVCFLFWISWFMTAKTVAWKIGKSNHFLNVKLRSPIKIKVLDRLLKIFVIMSKRKWFQCIIINNKNFPFCFPSFVHFFALGYFLISLLQVDSYVIRYRRHWEGT